MKTHLIKIRFLSLLFSMLMAGGVMIAQNTLLPYFNGFENPQDTAGWTFKKRPNTTGFEVGNAVHCLGSKSMYISPDGGATATYTTTASGYVSLAYKAFTLSAGTYDLAFDYQCGGDGINQDMKVAWVPLSTSLTATTLGSSYPITVVLNQFTDAENSNTFGRAVWKHVTGTITVLTAGTYNLCFAFRTNSQTVSAPGACVDNIQLDTVKSATDCTRIPYNIQVVKDPQLGVIITWSGNATEYEVIAASATDPLDCSFCQHDGITTNSDTMQYSELGEGQYFFYVRAICGSDTSMYGEISGVLIYDVSSLCIDFTNFDASGTQCTYGVYSNPYQTNGYIDNGPSQMSSRHTVHTDLNETDPRTNGALHTVPAGEVMSVRLGNWNNGSEAESVTYTYDVPAGSNLILIMKYAVVFEEPGHSEPPEFKLEIMDANNQLLDPVCAKVNFLCDGTLTQGWHRTGAYWYKDWTTIGVNLSNYAGQTVKIRLTTKDCNWSCHFGYAYYTLDCASAELIGIPSSSGDSTELKAPDGFNYQWISNCTGEAVATTRTIRVAATDTCLYTCECSNKEQPNCTFSLSVSVPSFPESSFSYSLTYSDCQTHINFTNSTKAYIINDEVKSYMHNPYIARQIWSIQTNHSDRQYYNTTSTDWNFQTIDIPKEGDTISVTLASWINNNMHDTTVTIYVPALHDSHTVTDRYVCKGTPIMIDGGQYTFITSDSIEEIRGDSKRYITGQDYILEFDSLVSKMGCDSLAEYHYKMLVADTFWIDTVLRNNEQYCLTVKNHNADIILDTCIDNVGQHWFHILSSDNCDSLVYIIFISTVGTMVDNVSGLFGVTLWPNPVHVGELVHLTTDFDVATVEVYNIHGQCVNRTEYVSSQVVIDALPTAGVYIVRVTNKEGKYEVFKLIVE